MGQTRRLLPVAVLLTVLVTACVAGRPPSRPATAAAPTSTADRAAAAAQAERRLALKVHRLHVAVDPQGATLRIQTAGGAVRATRTPFTGRLRGGHLVLTLTRSGRNTLTQRVLLDRDRSLELWMDPAGLLHHQVGMLTTGPNPKQVAFSPDGRELWVSLLGGHGVQVFDVQRRKLLDQIRLGEQGAVEVIFTADGRTVFASQMETASVFEIDRRTRKVRRQLFTKGSWSKVMALSPDERTLYVANWVSNDVSEIDLASGKVRRLLPTVRTPRGLYLTADGRRLFVAGYADGQIERIDLRTGASKALLRTGGAMRHLVGDPQRGRLYADDMALGRVFVVDLATERVRRLATTDKMPNTIDLSPDGRLGLVRMPPARGQQRDLTVNACGQRLGKAAMLDTAALDRDVAVLHSSAREWVTTPLAEKRKLLEALRGATAEVADEWVRLSCQGKGIALTSPAAGQEWMSGPYALLSNVAALIRLVEHLEKGTNPLDRVRVRMLPSGQVALRAFPAVVQDLVLAGYTGYVWLRPGVTLEQAKAGVARRLRDTTLPGQVSLVLGAGNINSIPPLDGLTKLYQDNAVVLIKLNPVNAYLAPVLNRAFAPFVERGFVRIMSGGIDVGSYLVRHPEVDSIHITGNSASHDAVVFGPGEEGARRKQAREPPLTKPITSELGGVGPVVVVPGRWRDAALRLQAQNVATQRLHNSGFNCIATQIVVVPQNWPQAVRFLDYLRQAIRDAPDRPAYYPGAADRQRGAVKAHPEAELLGGDPDVPRTLLTDLHPDNLAEPAFRTEYFGPVLGVTRLPGATAAEFLDNAVDFCNDRLLGDLGAGLIAAPQTIRELGPLFDAAVARLRYGTVAINCWVGPVFAMPRGTWGAFPGHDVYDVGSGVGIVHNALLLDPDHVERSVGRGPFHPWPKPLWFVTNRTADTTGEQMTRFAAETSLGKAMPRVLAALTSSLRG